MNDTIMQIIQWAIPSGGIGAAIAWVANRKVKAAESAKTVHDTYKLMYEDISRELVTTQKKVDESVQATDQLREENARTRRALNRLTRAIEAIKVCPHRATCPVSGELSLDEEGSGEQPGGAKPDSRDTDTDRRRQRRRKADSRQDTDRQPDADADGHDGVDHMGADRDDARRTDCAGDEGRQDQPQPQHGQQPGRQPQRGSGHKNLHQCGQPAC